MGMGLGGHAGLSWRALSVPVDGFCGAAGILVAWRRG